MNPSYALSGVNVVKGIERGISVHLPGRMAEISVDGQAKVYKDIIEPLESISLNIYPTERIVERYWRAKIAEALVKRSLRLRR